MAKKYDWKTALKGKSEEELFNIYCGYPKHFQIDVRYFAARVLESRDFKFKEVSAYKEKWRQEKLQKQAVPISSIFTNFVTSLTPQAQKQIGEKNLIELSH